MAQNGRNHKYGFTGKEEQEELGLGWVDITARNYDPALGRWMNLDPLAELMRRHSPYNYAFDNPTYFLDADGMMPTSTGDPGKKVILSQTSSGTTNAPGLVRGRVGSRSFCSLCNQSVRSLYKAPSSNNFSGRSEVITANKATGNAEEAASLYTGVEFNFSSVSETIASTIGVFKDGDGNVVSEIAKANSLEITEISTTTTVDVDEKNQGDVSISTTKSVTNFDVISQGGENFLENKSSKSETTLSAGNFDKISPNLKGAVSKVMRENQEMTKRNYKRIEINYFEGEFEEIFREAQIEESQSQRY